jgi:FAD-dependent sensor of blue light
MCQLLYTSKATHPFTDNELKHLPELARPNNTGKFITGMLLYCNSHFIELLEGNEADLLALFY